MFSRHQPFEPSTSRLVRPYAFSIISITDHKLVSATMTYCFHSSYNNLFCLLEYSAVSHAGCHPILTPLFPSKPIIQDFKLFAISSVTIFDVNESFGGMFLTRKRGAYCHSRVVLHICLSNTFLLFFRCRWPGCVK